MTRDIVALAERLDALEATVKRQQVLIDRLRALAPRCPYCFGSEEAWCPLCDDTRVAAPPDVDVGERVLA